MSCKELQTSIYIALLRESYSLLSIYSNFVDALLDTFFTVRKFGGRGEKKQYLIFFSRTMNYIHFAYNKLLRSTNWKGNLKNMKFEYSFIILIYKVHFA